MDNDKNLPFFKYNPNAYQDKEYFSTQNNICKCCNKPTNMWTEWMYCVDGVDCVCAQCIYDGSAAKKFNGEFVDFIEPGVDDADKTDELIHRTPGYLSWQGEHWLVCCADYCAFVGHVGTKELVEMGIADETIRECEEVYDFAIDREFLEKDGSLAGYLFQCLHCGKYHLWVDCD